MDANTENVHLEPVILNQDSPFVVITYWWGRGNVNRNLQTPCPYLIEDAAKKGKTLKVKKEGKTYDAMIDDWVNNMKRHRMNYLVAEYPMFAVKGAYQNAINYKPYFIENALRACYPRGVLYIDGDMFIKKYPRILDDPGIDFAGRSWAIDVKAWDEDVEMCYDPYVFETSGGTLYFGQTKFGKMLLTMWQEEMKKQHGKAEDRVISLIVNNKKLMADLNMVQLPINYLWLSLLYDPNKDLKKERKAIITHPYCLTSEEAAIELSDEMLKKMQSRIPKKYGYYVENNVTCNRANETIYEYITYQTSEASKHDSDFNLWLQENGDARVVSYRDKYGDFNEVAERNKEQMRKVKRVTHDNVVFVSSCLKFKSRLGDVHYIEHGSAGETVIPTILSYLSKGQHVIYIPNRHSAGISASIKALLKRRDDGYQFVAKNTNDSLKHFKRDYMLKLNLTYPIYFSPDNRILFELLTISENLKKVSQQFNSSSTFLSRIRCNWL
jgi:hypothetical protein